MFIRPVGATVHAANRPAGQPLLRGLLARAAGAVEATTGAVGPDEPPRRGLLARAVQAAGGPAEAPDWAWPEGEPTEEPEPLYLEEPEPEDEAPTVGPTPPAGHLVAELTQLADLAREGLLTPQEFTTAKARLLRD
ncbi:SHOCT domain-containing protein [Streptomyces sp. NBC_01294]|uniref:SHOCT domain-containing protein n=1 Tax=Streptomyces sp. NBC_01294 TaxID=2903815 RepID=UPI002DDA065C|nr:SHOCT domain-containing protein [Streptomyces sp. NBC_01294]WRZ57100.1 SHOCT domain-containing protein [Streptomyces sp. NBC_01294]